MGKSKNNYKHKKKPIAKKVLIKQSLAERVIVIIVMVTMIGGSAIGSILYAINPPSTKVGTTGLDEDMLHQMGLTDEQIASMISENGGYYEDEELVVHDNLFSDGETRDESTNSLLSDYAIGDKIDVPTGVEVGENLFSNEDTIDSNGGLE